MNEYNPFMDEEFRSAIKRYVLKNSGQAADADDLLSDGYLVYQKSQQSGEVKVIQSAKGYAYGICRNIWRNHLSKKVYSVEEIHADLALADKADGFESLHSSVTMERDEWMEKKLQESGSNCKEILRGKAEGKSSKELAKVLELTEDTINSRANQCRKKMMALLLEPLGTEGKKLLQIFNPRRRKEWYSTTFKEKHSPKLLDMGYPSFEVARDAAITHFDKLFSFLFPNSFN